VVLRWGWGGESECGGAGQQGGDHGVQGVIAVSADLLGIAEVEPGCSVLQLVNQPVQRGAACLALVAAVRQTPEFESGSGIDLDNQVGAGAALPVAHGRVLAVRVQREHRPAPPGGGQGGGQSREWLRDHHGGASRIRTAQVVTRPGQSTQAAAGGGKEPRRVRQHRGATRVRRPHRCLSIRRPGPDRPGFSPARPPRPRGNR
jgi:hypothetical protein